MAKKCATIVVVIALVFACLSAGAQGTAFSYQGFLTDNGIPAHGSFDLQFSLFNSNSGGTPLTAPVLTDDLSITNGLFTVTLDFGAGQFTGADRWVEIGVRPGASTGSYTALLPRQPISRVPYAIFAGGVSATGIMGTILAGNIGSGTITSNMLAPGAAAANLGGTGATILSMSANATNLIAAGYSRFGGQVDLSWQKNANPIPASARYAHTAIWTGNKMIIWGGSSTNPGGIYDPAANSWSAVATSNAPVRSLSGHTAVWTGTEMIAWGGEGQGGETWSNLGFRYNPVTDSWSQVSTNNAPDARRLHSAVWTGSKMIVWGGNGIGDVQVKTGGRYDPTTDSWTAISTNGAPDGRILHTTIWTGSEMLVWGGLFTTGSYSGEGARYNPATDTWSPITTNGAPAARYEHTAVWTGARMIVWGGRGAPGDGAWYDPTNDTWSAISSVGSPSARSAQTAIWTGTEMIVWGGVTTIAPGVWFNTGGRYNPANDRWSEVSTTGAPGPRQGHTAVWSGSDMIVFGGYNNDISFGDTLSYAPSRVMYLYLRP